MVLLRLCYMITGIIRNYKMITIENYENYNRAIGSLNLHGLSCSCGHAGCLIRHGHYTRGLKTPSGTIHLRILRVKCKICGRTHALLPDMVVPYSQLPADLQQMMLLYPLGSDELEKMMDGNPDITESDVLRVRYSFRHHWEQRLKAIGADLCACIHQLMDQCYKTFRRQFMQIRRGVYLRFT